MKTGAEIAIDNLNTRLNEVRMKLTERRKKGFDTKIAELKIIIVPSKIQLAQATGDRKDIQMVNNLITEVQSEIDEAPSKDTDTNVRVEESEAPSENQKQDVMKEARSKIQEARQAISDGDIQKAKECYQRLVEMYKFIPQQMKRLTYSKIAELHTGIKKLKQ